MSLLMKQHTAITHLALYDIVNTPGINRQRFYAWGSFNLNLLNRYWQFRRLSQLIEKSLSCVAAVSFPLPVETEQASEGARLGWAKNWEEVGRGWASRVMWWGEKGSTSVNPKHFTQLCSLRTENNSAIWLVISLSNKISHGILWCACLTTTENVLPLP